MVIELIKFLGENGARFTVKSLDQVAQYYTKMIKENRIVCVFENREIHTYLAISICDDFWSYYRKDTWDYKPHLPNGKICFIEHLISIEYSKEVRTLIENEILKLYPNVEKAIWFRRTSGDDRQVNIPIRRKSCTK